MTVPAGVLAEADADAWLKDALARALEANERLRERNAQREAELERVTCQG